jgi:hypothetical protein
MRTRQPSAQAEHRFLGKLTEAVGPSRTPEREAHTVYW